MGQKNLVLKEMSQSLIGTLGSRILRNALLYPDKEAFIYGDITITFGDYNKRVNSLIHALNDMGVKKQEVMGVLSWNCLEYQDVYGAAEKGGFVIAPFNPRLSIEELDYLINDSQAKTLFIGPEFVEMANNLKHKIPHVKNLILFENAEPEPGMISHAELLKNYPAEEPEVSVDEGDLVYIFYTSGTTGVPRGAIYDHRRQWESYLLFLLELGILPGDRNLMMMPMFHTGGAVWCRVFFGRGCLNVILKQFDPEETLLAIQNHKITDIHIVPTHLAFMLDVPGFEKYDVGSVKQMFYAASPMPEELLKRGLKVWGPIFVQGYGQTESGPIISLLHKCDHDVLEKAPEIQTRLTSCGQPAITCQVRIVDDQGYNVPPGEVGEITVKSRHNMLEYWNKPEYTADTLIEGWLHTGDMGRYDEEGYIYLVDRKKDMIISGGENIYPREVEEVLYRHKAVLECCVIGIPDPKWIESVHAIVSFKRRMTATPEELIDFCKQNMAGYKTPKSLEILEELPKSGAGKILKRVLREKYWTKPKRKV